MKVEVTQPMYAPPEQRVVLDLSVAEFALLEALRYHNVAGASALRAEVRRGFEDALGRLHPDWRNSVETARQCGSDSTGVQRIVT